MQFSLFLAVRLLYILAAAASLLTDFSSDHGTNSLSSGSWATDSSLNSLNSQFVGNNEFVATDPIDTSNSAAANVDHMISTDTDFASGCGASTDAQPPNDLSTTVSDIQKVERRQKLFCPTPPTSQPWTQPDPSTNLLEENPPSLPVQQKPSATPSPRSAAQRKKKKQPIRREDYLEPQPVHKYIEDPNEYAYRNWMIVGPGDDYNSRKCRSTMRTLCCDGPTNIPHWAKNCYFFTIGTEACRSYLKIYCCRSTDFSEILRMRLRLEEAAGVGFKCTFLFPAISGSMNTEGSKDDKGGMPPQVNDEFGEGSPTSNNDGSFTGPDIRLKVGD